MIDEHNFIKSLCGKNPLIQKGRANMKVDAHRKEEHGMEVDARRKEDRQIDRLFIAKKHTQFKHVIRINYI